jgi:dynein heavy chain
MTLMTLQLARSKVIKQWRDTDRKITFCYNEARDNAKFIQSMEKCCHSLYLHDPVSHLTYLQFMLDRWFEENM